MLKKVSILPREKKRLTVRSWHTLTLPSVLHAGAYSQLSLNGHLYRAGTWCWSVPFSSHFTATILTLRRTTDTFEAVNRHLGRALCSEKYPKTNGLVGVLHDIKLQKGLIF